MSKLDAITEKVGGRAALPPTENFALLVTGYGQDDQNRDTVQGMRLDTGEEISVVLRAYRGTTKAARAEVKDFVADEGEISAIMKSLPTDEMRRQVLKGIKAKTEPGGTIIVQRAYTERKTGIVNAGWLQSAAKYADHCKIASNVMVRVDPPIHKREGEREYSSASATVLAPQKAQVVRSEEELKAALKTAFAGLEDVKGRPLVLVRVSDGTNAKTIEYPLPIKRNPEFGKADATQPLYLTATPGQAATKFINDQGEDFKALIGDPDLQMEVIPGTVVQIGPQAKASFENKNDGLDAVNAGYRFVKDDPKEAGFTASYIILHAVGDNQVFSAVEPLSNKPPLYHPRDVSTAFYRGRPTVVQDSKADVAHPVAVETASPADAAPADDEVEFDVSDAVAASAPSAPRPRP
ncbi:hypothetical protein AB4Y43_17040 [Paraburkholderia sp. BR10872]|uniref:hypothetical protein n=1 Tax=Paraburkholderia sp. BR10872 TaxID=3236989 RepID=UPI0034D23193